MTKKAWKPRGDVSAMLDQLRVAAQQLDAEPGGMLGWIVRFAREDPARWLPADREAHGYRLLAFAGFGGATWMLPSVRPLTPREVTGLHAELRGLLRALVSVPAAQTVEIPADGLRTGLLRATPPGVKPAIFGYSRGGPLRTMLFQKLGELVAVSTKLLGCRFCNEPFLSLLKQRFCGPKCTQQWHDREKRANHAKGGKR